MKPKTFIRRQRKSQVLIRGTSEKQEGLATRVVNHWAIMNMYFSAGPDLVTTMNLYLADLKEKGYDSGTFQLSEIKLL